jgi:hypothetical protein
MGCCGKARANLNVSPATMSQGSTTGSVTSRESMGKMPFAPADAGRAPVQLRYAGSSPVVVRGPATGRSYSFSQGGQINTVDRRDAVVLLRTHYFRQA